MNLTCFVVDDEAHALEVMVRYVQCTPGIEVVGAEENPLVALETITSSNPAPDLVFLDVDMPQLSGMDLAGLLRTRTEIIFTTAFPDYALQAFDRDAVDYLLKPIAYERFLQAVGKVRDRLLARRGCSTLQETSSYFFVKSDMKGKKIRVVYDKIHYVEGLQNYIRIHMRKDSLVIYLTLKEMEESLPSPVFLRIHKSFIVNIDQVQAVEGNQIILYDKRTLPIGATYREAFLEKVDAKLVKSRRTP